MDNYRIYCELETKLREKKSKLSDLKSQFNDLDLQIKTLEINIEEDTSGLNMIFDYLVAESCFS